MVAGVLCCVGAAAQLAAREPAVCSALAHSSVPSRGQHGILRRPADPVCVFDVQPALVYSSWCEGEAYAAHTRPAYG